MSNLMKLSKEWQLSTALYDAIEDANVRQVASLLLEKRANPNIIIPDYGIAPFHLAVGHENERFSKEITKFMLKNGGDPNLAGIDGVTPLHIAVAWNRSVLVRLLLSYGADPWILDDSEKNSFHYGYEEQAWDALKTLEIFRRTQGVGSDVNEKKNYSIQLDKVIIHANDVQAEYRPHYNGSCCNTSKLTQTTGTQTPLPVTRFQSSDESPDFSYDITKDFKECDDNLCGEVTKDAKESDVNFTVDDSFEWCLEAQDLMITDDCKRKIILHRSRSKVYEYSPGKKPLVYNGSDEVDGEAARKFFNEPNSRRNSSHRNSSNHESSDSKADSLNTVEEKVPKKSVDVQVQTVACSNDMCINLVQFHKLSPDSYLFSEESLMSEDQSDCVAAKEKPIFYRLETLSLTDASASVSSLTTDKAASRKNESPMSTPQRKSKKCEKSTMVSRDDLKAVSWSRCLRNCTCINKRINESDSFTAYQTGAKNKSELVSGVDLLPEHTVEKSAEKRDSGSSGIDLVDVSESSSNYLDPNISIELKYTDEEDGIEFIEAKLPLSACSKPAKKSSESSKRSSSEGAVEESEPSDANAYDTDYIRKELRKVGFFPGPMAGTPTKRLYLKKLRRIKKTVTSPVTHFMKPSFSSELEQVLKDDSWVETLAKWSKLESDLRESFLDCSRSWRNGTAKTSFTYLLLDPRISDNLPARYEQMNLIDVWRTFTKAIFYIGKGTRARPYEHLHEAFLIWGETKASKKRRCSLKVKHILDIWNEGLGIVCVQAFHNLIPAEAFTREAAMIDAIGLPRLKNEKCGMYYGVAASWNSKLKRRLGAFLLYRALRIFIAQNEIQLKPTDVK